MLTKEQVIEKLKECYDPEIQHVSMNYPLLQGHGGPVTCHGGGAYRAKVNVGKDFFVDKKPQGCFIN